jgi:hypothetical protein
MWDHSSGNRQGKSQRRATGRQHRTNQNNMAAVISMLELRRFADRFSFRIIGIGEIRLISAERI